MRLTACLLVVALLGDACASVPAVATQQASAPPSPIANTARPGSTASATASPLAPGTFENAILGYRITLPVTYRRVRSLIIPGQPELLGLDTYTTATEAQARADCLLDHGDIPSPFDAAALIVWAYRNVVGVSAAEWVRSRPEAKLHTVEPDTIGGLQAVRLVQQGETQMYVIRATDRIYELSPTLWPSQQPLAAIAASFTLIARQPFPTPTPSPSLSPREAAGTLGKALAAALAARDADAVARSFGTDRCAIGVSAIVAGSPTGGALNRSIANFVQGLRDRFAAGDLTVTVDPAVQVRTDGGGDHFFVGSDWREPDRTTRIDLELAEIDGQWRWIGATHYYPSLIGQGCIPYRSPWVTPTGTC